MPNMTNDQITTLRAAILAETDPAFVAARDAGATNAMADFYNAPASPAHMVWGTAVPVGVISDAIDFAAYTPNGTIDGMGAITNRLLAAQTKQISLQLMLQGRDALNCSRTRVRGGLLDAVTNLPTGAAGAIVSAGGTDGQRVMNALTRPATRGEKLFTDPAATTGTVSAFRLTYEGQVSGDDISRAVSQA